MKYFAYGANMDPDEMARHCKNAAFISRARLLDHLFVYDNFSEGGAEGWGNVIPKEGETVWGALYTISETDLKSLEEKEGCPIYYQIRTAEVEDDFGQVHQAALFSRAGKCIGKPSERYRSMVVSGAQIRALPEAYIGRFLNT